MMTNDTIEFPQRTAARWAGALYILTIAIAMSGELLARDPLLVPNDAVQTAKNLVASEHLFRIGIVSMVIMQAGVVALLWALYVVLRPVNRDLALLAAFWRLLECAGFSLIVMSDFSALKLVSGAPYLSAVDAGVLQALARFFLSMHHVGGQSAIVFFGLGSTIFAVLWLKSRYIPRALAGFGILSSLLVMLLTLVALVEPRVESAIGPAYWIPVFLFEVILGVWLLTKGIRTKEAA